MDVRVDRVDRVDGWMGWMILNILIFNDFFARCFLRFHWQNMAGSSLTVSLCLRKTDFSYNLS